MGRLAVVLGSNALGPGGEALAAAAAEHGAAIVQRHGEDAYACRTRSTTPPTSEPLAELGCDRVLAIGSVGSLQRRSPGRQHHLPRRLHRPAPRHLDLR